MLQNGPAVGIMDMKTAGKAVKNTVRNIKLSKAEVIISEEMKPELQIEK